MFITKRRFSGNEFTISQALPKEKYLLLFVESGKGKVLYNNAMYSVKNGCFILCKPLDNIKYCFSKGDSLLYFAEFSTSELLFPIQNLPIGVHTCHDFSLTLELLINLNKVFICKEPLWESKARTILCELLSFLSPVSEKENLVSQALNELCLEIHESFPSGDVDITKYADRLDLSKDRLSVLFKERFGYPPYKYQLMLKMQEASFLLTHTSLSVGEISEKLGFSSPLYFSSAYKKQTGVTPSDMRKTH